MKTTRRQHAKAFGWGPFRRPRFAPLTLVVASASIVAVSPLGAIRQPESRVLVRVYDTSGQTWNDLTGALDVARQALSVTRTAVVWRVCDRERRDGTRDNCATRPAEEELIVRILRGPRSSPRIPKTALGHAVIDAGSGTGILATIYFDRVDKKAVQTQTAAPTLLGLAIAHELGHLLVGTAEHAAEGLMRTEWTRGELRTGRTADWSFTLAEIATIRSRAALRSSAGVIEIQQPDRQIHTLARLLGAGLHRLPR